MKTRQFFTGVALFTALGNVVMAAEPHHQHAAVNMVAAAPPAAPFRPIDSVVPMPKFVPGYGYFYVDPANLPAGPFLGYDRQGKLVGVTYMLPLKDLNDKKGFPQLGTSVAGMQVDHTDVSYNNGHPGVAAPHIHVTQWLIPHEDEKQLK